MKAGEDIELNISITDPDGAAVDLDGCIFSLSIKDVYVVSYYMSSNYIVIPASVTIDWPAGNYPIQYKLTLTDGSEIYDEIKSVTIKSNLIKEDLIIQNNIFPYSFPHGY